MCPERPQARRACLVAIFKWIQSALTLDHFSLRGYVTNDGRQSWFITNQIHVREQSIRARVEQFVIRGGICPLDKVAIPHGYYDYLQPRRHGRER